MKYPYIEVPNSEEPDKPNYKPLFQVVLSHQSQSRKFVALIDSGADISIAHADIGRLLGVDIPSGRPTKYGGSVGNTPGTGYIHRIHLTIPKHSGLDIDFTFTEDIRISDAVLLGQRDFFQKYEINFSLARGYFEVINPADKGR